MVCLVELIKATRKWAMALVPYKCDYEVFAIEKLPQQLVGEKNPINHLKIHYALIITNRILFSVQHLNYLSCAKALCLPQISKYPLCSIDSVSCQCSPNNSFIEHYSYLLVCHWKHILPGVASLEIM